MSKVLLLVLTLLLTTEAAFASPGEEPSPASFPGDWRLDFRNITFGQFQKPVESSLNPGNRLKLSRYRLGSQFRPDLTASLGPVDLLVKPRLELLWFEWEENYSNPRAETDVDLFVQEWQVRWRLHDTLFLAYGREDLQWGPSYMLSPSNPFSSKNGKNQPKFEVPSADFARLTWLPGPTWTGSLIVNTNQGRKESTLDFKPTYAIKLDYLMDSGYFSLIFSKRETQQIRTGLFGSYNLDDAFLIHAEGSLVDDEAAFLIGGTYTFANGSVLAVEYFYNGEGAQNNIPLATILADNGTQEKTFLRRNYGLLQYAYQPPTNNWSLLLRWTQGFDDNSSLLLGHGEYDLGERTQLFLSALVLRGDQEDEFSYLVEYRATLG